MAWGFYGLAKTGKFPFGKTLLSNNSFDLVSVANHEFIKNYPSVTVDIAQAVIVSNIIDTSKFKSEWEYYDAFDNRNHQFLYKWAHPLNFGDNENLQRGYDGLSAIGNAIFRPSKPRGQSTAKTGVKNSRRILNENGISQAIKEGVNEHNIPFFLSNPDRHDSNSARKWEIYNNIQNDPYGANALIPYFGADENTRASETTLRRYDDVRHRKNSAVLNFGGKTPQNIFEPQEGIPEEENEVISERRLIKHLINVVLPNAQNSYLQSDTHTKQKNATFSRYYGEKSFL